MVFEVPIHGRGQAPSPLLRTAASPRPSRASGVVMTAMSSAMSMVGKRELGFLREILVASGSPHLGSLGKTAGRARLVAAQGTIMLMLTPLVGMHLAPVVVAEVIFFSALTFLAFGCRGLRDPQ